MESKAEELAQQLSINVDNNNNISQSNNNNNNNIILIQEMDIIENQQKNGII